MKSARCAWRKPNLKKMFAIGLDVGLQDGLAASNAILDETLTRFDVPHTYEAGTLRRKTAAVLLEEANLRAGETTVKRRIVSLH
jgi:hypothetical protein